MILVFVLIAVTLLPFSAIAYTITTSVSGVGAAYGTVEFAPYGMFNRGRTLYVGGGGPGNYTTVAAAFAAALTNDTIFVFSGTYDCNGEGTVAKNITLFGEDKNTTVLKRSVVSARYASVLVISGSNMNITGFTIDNSLAYTNYGIQTSGTGGSGSTISNCIINNMTVSGIICYDGASNITITGNTIRRCNYSCILVQRVATAFNCFHINIIDNIINGTTDPLIIKYVYGISMNNTYDSVISNNHISSFSYANILFNSDSNCTIYSNEIMDYYMYGFLINDGSNNIIKSNCFQHGRGASLYIDTSPSSLVYSNLFIDCLNGVSFEASDFCEVIGNLFTDITGLSGCDFDFGSDFGIIYNNNFIDNAEYGLIIGSTATFIDVEQNNFINNPTRHITNDELTFTNIFSLNFYDDYTGVGYYNIYDYNTGLILTGNDTFPVDFSYDYVFLNITNTIGLGFGSIQSNDGYFVSGDWVILWANETFYSYFSQWGGDASGNVWAIALLMDGNKTVSAEFGIYLYYYYAICWANTSNPKYYFAEWSGDMTGGTSPDYLLVDGAKSIDARFDLAPIIRVTVRYENETEGINHVVDLSESFTGIHKLLIYYGNKTDTVTFDNLAGTGCIHTSTLNGSFNNNASGTFQVNLSIYEDPKFMEFRWNDSFGQIYYCSRKQIYTPGQENYTFYIRTDLLVYEETTLYFNNSLVKYKLSFNDETGKFIYPNNPYIEIYRYNSTLVRQLIHSEFMDSTGRIYPWLVFGDDYFLGAHSDPLNIDRIGHITATTTIDQTDLRIPYQQSGAYNVYDLCSITYGWYGSGIWVHYVDTTGSTIYTEFTVYNYTDETYIPAATEVAFYAQNRNYTFSVAQGCTLTQNYKIQINTTINGLSNEFYAGNYSTGKLSILVNLSGITTNETLDDIIQIIFGDSPIHDSGGTSFLPWTYIVLFGLSFILLVSFGKLNAFIGGLATGVFLTFAGAIITGVQTLFSNYAWWNGPVLAVIGVFIIAISIVGLLGGVEK